MQLHIDAEQTLRKEKTRLAKDWTWRNIMNKLENNFTTFKKNASKGVWTPKSTMTKITKGLTSIYPLTRQNKEQLVERLCSGFDYNNNNARRLGMVKNLELIRSVPLRGRRDSGDVRALLGEYVILAQQRDAAVSRGHHRHVYSVFVSDSQDPILTNTSQEIFSMALTPLNEGKAMGVRYSTKEATGSQLQI
ncbi:hypothetical protein EDD11_009917 [Mortierella claussenii]|nr:hypothetical protein EDD11_009917 [Mortierella claussenii]